MLTRMHCALLSDIFFFFFSSRRRHTRFDCDWSSDVCSSDLPALGETIWDTSYVLPDDSVIGKLMHTLVGYTARPYGIQLGFYAVTLTVILALTKITQGSSRRLAA